MVCAIQQHKPFSNLRCHHFCNHHRCHHRQHHPSTPTNEHTRKSHVDRKKFKRPTNCIRKMEQSNLSVFGLWHKRTKHSYTISLYWYISQRLIYVINTNTMALHPTLSILCKMFSIFDLHRTFFSLYFIIVCKYRKTTNARTLNYNIW